jgi:hypothetical protein
MLMTYIYICNEHYEKYSLKIDVHIYIIYNLYNLYNNK